MATALDVSLHSVPAVMFPANSPTLARGSFMAASAAGVEAARKLREYWVHGPGAAKIGWGSPGDFKRCVAHLGKYVSNPEGLCNEYHQAALGGPPGKGH